MSQTRLGSWVEVIATAVIKYLVALTIQITVFPLFGIDVPMTDHLAISFIFLTVSVIQSYILRRIFNRIRLFHRTHS